MNDRARVAHDVMLDRAPGHDVKLLTIARVARSCATPAAPGVRPRIWASHLPRANALRHVEQAAAISTLGND